MKIILTSIGTRGDIEPFLSIGEILKKKKHHIICLFPEQFRDLAENSGFEFVSLGSKFGKLLKSPEGRIAMGGGKLGIKKIKAFLKLISMQPEATKEMMLKQEECIESQNPDRIIHHPKATYPILWSIKNKGKTTLVCPVPYMHYVKGHPHIIFHSNFGTRINKLTYKLADYGLVKSVSYSQKWLKNKHKKLTSKKIIEALHNNDVIYTISPSLFARPKYWNSNLKVLGFHERDKTINWTPSIELKQFLQHNPKIIFITFGSMINPFPKRNTELILQIIEQNKIPAIINTCEGGLVKPVNYKHGLVYFTNNIPYDWIFPQIYAVVHHGGSGTTHMALKYGCATLIIPHIVDQYVWNKIAYRKGVGPLGIDVSKITKSNLEPKIIDLFQNKNYKQNAENLSKKILKENFKTEIYNTIIN